ncbi:ABC transporter substrate-binding protein [Gracilibacillus sp. HCP3S3_G5_1]|uniref:ABC transporter substrate-binding protein n=1 Tax=unclassified Gracilibacillus TaxID=2625209 RepID=UPI003F8BDFAE
MKLIEHYNLIFRRFKVTHQEIQITVHDIADLLSCSHRNAKIILRKFEEQNWIEWKPGKGRGNYSSMILLENVETLLINEAKNMLTPTSIDAAIRLLRKHEVRDSLQREFVDWIFHSYLNEQIAPADGKLSRLQFPSYRPLPVLDPAKIWRRSENHIMRHIFSTLVFYQEEDNKFLPHLAHHWRHNADYTKWIFYLQKGVLFHHGEEMTGEDVRYSFIRHKKSPSAYEWIVEDLEEIKVRNNYVVEFEFGTSCPYFLHLASSLGGSIIPMDIPIVEQKPIGTGPFKVTENDEEKLVLTVFREYFLRCPFLDEITIYFFPKLYDNATDLNHIPHFEEMNFYHYPYQGRKLQNFNKYTKLDKGSKLLTLNLQRGILSNNALLRDAIFHFILPIKIIDELGGSRYKAASHLLEKSEGKEQKRTISEGRSALAKSGYKGEILTLVSYRGAGNEADAEWIQKVLFDEGIIVRLKFYDYVEIHKHPLSKEADLILGEQIGDESDLYTYLSAFRGNHSLLKYHLPRESISACCKKDENIFSLLKQIESKCIEQNGHIHLYRLNQFAFYPHYVKGVSFNALGWIDFTKVWYEA